MCAINPKRKYKVLLEFYTAHDMADRRWLELTVERVLRLEQEWNASGEVRVHVVEHPE